MSALLIRTIAELRGWLSERRRAGQNVGLVPTMGALHAGHGSLMDHAHRENACVVTSIFVNPIQFNQAADFVRYPRTLDTDLEFCRARGVDAVFAPPATEMYPSPQQAFVEVARVADKLEGEFRPGHFRGVATVVLKLFHMVQPDRAYFGEKDAQQLAVIRRMVADLNLPVEIVAVPTLRENDGLAMSSRNRLLSPPERRVAPVLYEALRAAGEAVAAGVTDAAEVRRRALAVLAREPGMRVEYLEVADPDGMQPVGLIAGPALVVAAVWLGNTRLIDNLLCRPL